MRTIACLNLKGGSGKSTTALALAVGLAQRLPKRQRVLLVDSDPQANSTLIMMNGKVPQAPTLTDVLLDDTFAIGAIDAIRPTRLDRLDVLPSDGRLAECTVLLANETGRELRLSIALQSVEDAYSVCVVDSPPQLSLLTLNIMKAAAEILVPIDPGLFAIAGLGRLQETVDKVRHHLQHPDLVIAGLLVTQATKNKITIDLERQLREVYGELVYKAVIPDSVKIEEAHASYRSILEWDPKSPVGKAYNELVTEVLNGHGRHPKRQEDRPHVRKPGSRRGNAA
jgi:chromosome partitioning protein